MLVHVALVESTPQVEQELARANEQEAVGKVSRVEWWTDNISLWLVTAGYLRLSQSPNLTKQEGGLIRSSCRRATPHDYERAI